MAYAKPFLSIAQQIALLQSRGMRIPDAARATAYLERVGYYRLSGYWFPFRQSRAAAGIITIEDQFKPGTSFDDIIGLYVFDKRLRMLMLDAIERVEIGLRVQICLLLGAIDPLAHRDPTVLDGKFARMRSRSTGRIPHQDWLNKTDQAFDNSREEFATHFRANYSNDRPPVWIACEAWDFGALSRLFDGLKTHQKGTISANYGVSGAGVLETWIRNINVARNISAHHARLWNRVSAIQPRWPVVGAIPQLDHLAANTRAQTRVYGTAAILRVLLRSISPGSSWAARFVDLWRTFPASPHIGIASAGFPARWDGEDLWK